MKKRLDPRIKAVIGALAALAVLWGGKELARLLISRWFGGGADTASMPFCRNTLRAGLAEVERGSVLSTPMDSSSARYPPLRWHPPRLEVAYPSPMPTERRGS